MPRVKCVELIGAYRIAVRFDDGVEGVVDLTNDLWGPAFEPLRNPDVFARVSVNEFGAVSWPNGVDLCPDSMYQDLLAARSAAIGSRS